MNGLVIIQMNKLISIIKNNEKLVKNFSYLSIIKIVTLFLPLFTYPYLLKTLGQSNYGLLIYSQAVVGYFVIFVNFGFSITTTREISQNRDNLSRISEIISATYFAKVLFFVISLLILYLLSIYINDIHQHFSLFLYTLLWLGLFEVFFPIYYFQGVEKMKYITMITLVSRVIFFICIFIFIKSKNDYVLFPIINLAGSLVGIICSLYILYKDGIRLIKPSFRETIYHIKSSYIMGLALGSNSLKSNLNLILIKNVLSFNEVAVFDLISKLLNIANTVIDLISQTVFPKLAKEKNKKFFLKLLKFVTVISIAMTLLYIAFGNMAIDLLSNNQIKNAYPVLILMSVMVPIYSIGTMLGRNCLNVYGYDRHVLYSMIISSFIYILVYLLLKTILKVDFNIYVFVGVYLLSFFVDTLYRYIICKKEKLI